jgi:alcohol dehydrogenase
MNRLVYRLKAGNIGDLKISSEILKSPNENEVQIKVRAIGLNFADIFAIWGLYSATPEGAFIPGLEFAGEIVGLGKKVKDFLIGEKVMGVIRFGAYANFLNIDSRYIRKLPPMWSLKEGASFLVQVLTAYYALHELGNLQENQRVLIHSGAGGVGLLANRIAKKSNAYTIASVGSTAKVDFLNNEGYDKVIVRSTNFSKDLKNSLSGERLDLILECIGGRILKESFEQLSPEGRMIVYGAAQFTSKGNRPNYLKLVWNYLRRPKIDPMTLPETNRSIMGFNLIWLYNNAEKMDRILNEIEKLNLASPHIGHEFEFDDLKSAIQMFRSGKTIGKVVINVKHNSR